jgi:hypothetical protein
MVSVFVRPPAREVDCLTACSWDSEAEIAVVASKVGDVAPPRTRHSCDRPKELHVAVLVQDAYLDRAGVAVETAAYPCLERSLDAEVEAALDLDFNCTWVDYASVADRSARKIGADAYRLRHLRA